MKKYVFFLLLSFTLFAHVFAQSTIGDDWELLQSDNGEFSIKVPGTPVSFYDREGFTVSPPGSNKLVYSEMRLLNSSAGKTVMNVEIYEPNNPKKCVKELIARDGFKDKKSGEKLDGFDIASFELNDLPNSDTRTSHISKYIISKTHLYVVSVSNRGPQSDESKYFLSSLSLKQKNANADPNGAVKISALESIGIAQIGAAATDLPPPVKKQPAENPVKNVKGVVIMTNPRPTYTDADRRAEVRGTMRLRATFAATGRISNLTLVSVLTEGLSRNAFFSTLRIKFIPAEKDEKLISTTKTLEYIFDIY